MDYGDLLRRLNHEYRVRLRLDEDQRELLLPRHEAALLPPDVKAAIKHHRDLLLRRTLFLDAHLRFDAWMAERGGADRDAEPRLSGRRGLGSGGTSDCLNEAWASADLDAFEAALSEYMRAGARAFLRAAESSPEPRQPALPR